MQIWTSQVVAIGVPLTDIILQQKGLELIRQFNSDIDYIK